MSEPMNWMEKMAQDNAALDKLEQSGALDNLGVEGGTVPPVDTTKPAEAPSTAQQTATNTAPTDALSQLIQNASVNTETPTTPAANATDGKFAEELERLKAENQRLKSEDGRMRKLQDQFDQLKKRNEELEQQITESQTYKPLEGRPMGSFNEEETEVLSEDMAGLLGSRFSRSEQMFQKQQEQIQRLQDMVRRTEGMAKEREREELRQALETQCPNFQQHCAGDAWKQYCSEVDPVTNRRNGELFMDSVNAGNSKAACAIVQRFMGASGIGGIPVSAGFKPGETSAYGAGTGGVSDTNVYSEGEINSFISMYNSGQIDRNSPNTQRAYQVYMAALQEGRVQ